MPVRGAQKLVRRFQVDGMSRLRFPLACFPAALGLSLVGICAAVTPARSQTGVELQPIRVIRLGGQGESEKVPVVSGVAISRDGDRLAAVGDDHLVRILNPHNGQVLHLLRGHRDWVRAAAFRPDGKALATAGDDQQIRLWNVPAERLPRTLPAHRQSVYALAYSPDGGMLAAAGFGDKVRIYDGADGRLLNVADAPQSDLRAVAFSPDGVYLAAAGGHGRIRLWNASTGRAVRELAGSHRRILALAYSPDGSLLASAGGGRTIRVWNTATGQPALDLPPQPGNVLALVFCGDTRLAAGGTDNVIRLWDLTHPSQPVRLVGHTGSVASLAFDPKTGTLVSGSFDTTVRIWKFEGQATVTLSRRSGSSRPVR